eukprot:TRINITY_DN37243_c0_g1_i1.p1 TRINITY_DN37243_c0_g1~~TRINITY_DN37243_c0_g1_i1.p1  ORF type:complete len:1086 (+),score=373.31 TRINITY_DN37243_c0_g1_i1:89-3346(+)
MAPDEKKEAEKAAEAEKAEAQEPAAEAEAEAEAAANGEEAEAGEAMDADGEEAAGEGEDAEMEGEEGAAEGEGEGDGEEGYAEGDEGGGEQDEGHEDDAGGEDEDDEEAAAAAAEVEKVKELEVDAPADSRAKLASGAVKINPADSTLNVLSAADGQIVMSLNDGGLQYLLAGVRGNTGLKAGRYAFEVQLVETIYISEHPNARGKAPHPKSVIRVGLSPAGSSSILCDDGASCYFDTEGFFTHGKKRTKAGYRHLRRGQIMTVVVNLDAESANANTLSLFVDGARISEPQAIPEEFRGKVLYPTVSYRCMSARINFGPDLLAKMPFTCRAIGDAAQDDVQVAAAPARQGRKPELLVPVGLPEEGAFDWLDAFHEENPGYEEISERKILHWAEKSGVYREGGFSWQSSKDRPDLQSGLIPLDNMTVNKVLSNVVPLAGKDIIAMSVKRNLVAEERKATLERFAGFRKVAVVAVGEPPEKQKEFARKALLEEKKKKALAKAEKEATEARRRRLGEERRKKLEAARAERAAKRARTESGDKEADDEKKEKDEEKAADGKEEAEKKEEEPAADDEVKVPEVSLSEEEAKAWYRRGDVPDLSPEVLAHSYANFSLPSEDEGFDEIRYVWAPAKEAGERIRAWILERKRTQKVDDLKPSEWFQETWSKWEKTVREWKDVFEKAKKAKDGKDSEEVADIQGVEDVKDVGGGVPLFARFSSEDWTLLNLRYELHLLCHAFRKDLNDEDRKNFPLEHAPHYYGKYYRRSLTSKQYGMEKLEDVIELVNDSVDVEKEMLVSKLAEDVALDTFIKTTEEQRRDRERRIDAGDESAKLLFSKAEPLRRPTGKSSDGKGSGKKGSKGSSKGERSKGFSSKGSSKGKSASAKSGDRDRERERDRYERPADRDRYSGGKGGGYSSRDKGGHDKGSSRILRPMSSSGGAPSRYASSGGGGGAPIRRPLSSSGGSYSDRGSAPWGSASRPAATSSSRPPASMSALPHRRSAAPPPPPRASSDGYGASRSRADAYTPRGGSTGGGYGSGPAKRSYSSSAGGYSSSGGGGYPAAKAPRPSYGADRGRSSAPPSSSYKGGGYRR